MKNTLFLFWEMGLVSNKGLWALKLFLLWAFLEQNDVVQHQEHEEKELQVPAIHEVIPLVVNGRF